MDTTNNTTTSNPRGIPSFPFLSNVNEYVKSLSDVEATLTRFQEMVSKYTFMQQNVERRAVGLREKLPEMKRTLEVVRFLRKKRGDTKTAPPSEGLGDEEEEEEDLDEDLDSETKGSGEIETTFSLQDTLYAKATIKPAEIDEVYLWLGANVMVAYPLAEADELLQGKLEKAKDSLVAAEEDLEFLRVQITTLEVAIARVHNWDVGEKRKLKSQGKLPAGKDDGEDDGKGKDDKD
jgi:prefoldin subunit 5